MAVNFGRRSIIRDRHLKGRKFTAFHHIFYVEPMCLHELEKGNPLYFHIDKWSSVVTVDGSSAVFFLSLSPAAPPLVSVKLQQLLYDQESHHHRYVECALDVRSRYTTMTHPAASQIVMISLKGKTTDSYAEKQRLLIADASSIFRRGKQQCS